MKMNYKLYSVYDNVAGIFYAPSMERNDATAMRSFTDLMKAEKFKEHQKDYDLYCVGSFDLATGLITGDMKRFICGGTAYAYEEDDLSV